MTVLNIGDLTIENPQLEDYLKKYSTEDIKFIFIKFLNEKIKSGENLQNDGGFYS